MKKILFVIIPLIIIGAVVVVVTKFQTTTPSSVQEVQLSGEIISSGDITSGATDILSGDIISNSGNIQTISGTTTTTQSNNPLVYTNSEFGFQLTLPEGWENYRVFKYDMRKNPWYSGFIAKIEIALPTNESTRYGIQDPNDSNYLVGEYTGQYHYITGYASMIGVSIWDPKYYAMYTCGTFDGGCINDDELLGKNKKYNYQLIGIQDMPTDLYPIWGNRKYFEKIIPTFKVL